MARASTGVVLRLATSVVLLAVGAGFGVASVGRSDGSTAEHVPASESSDADTGAEMSTSLRTTTTTVPTSITTARAEALLQPRSFEASLLLPVTGANVYQAENVGDGRPDTAWCTKGDGTGESVKLSYSAPVEVRRIGITPGYDKVDPTSGKDRYTSNRRVTRVRYTFSDGTTIEQGLDISNRSLQFVTLDASVTSTSVRISVLSVTPDGEDTCISEAQLWGAAAS